MNSHLDKLIDGSGEACFLAERKENIILLLLRSFLFSREGNILDFLQETLTES